jgi:hypothetical protein
MSTEEWQAAIGLLPSAEVEELARLMKARDARRPKRGASKSTPPVMDTVLCVR